MKTWRVTICNPTTKPDKVFILYASDKRWAERLAIVRHLSLKDADRRHKDITNGVVYTYFTRIYFEEIQNKSKSLKVRLHMLWAYFCEKYYGN